MDPDERPWGSDLDEPDGEGGIDHVYDNDDDPAYHRELREDVIDNSAEEAAMARLEVLASAAHELKRQRDDLTRAVEDLIVTATRQGPAVGAFYSVHPSYLTVLSRIVRDGCTYEEATDG